MSNPDPVFLDLDALSAEMAEDEKVDRHAKRVLSQEDIRRLVEEKRRHRETGRDPASE